MVSEPVEPTVGDWRLATDEGRLIGMNGRRNKNATDGSANGGGGVQGASDSRGNDSDVRGAGRDEGRDKRGFGENS